jgi:hypothetical protein
LVSGPGARPGRGQPHAAQRPVERGVGAGRAGS